MEFDDEIITLWPEQRSETIARVEQELAVTAGAVRDPADSTTWFLPHPQAAGIIRQQRLDDPTRYPAVARVIVRPDHVVVFPDDTEGRARKFVTWLLSLGPWDVAIRDQAPVRVGSPAEIYANNTWVDPDASADPTEIPPRTGTVLVIKRHHRVGGNVSESVLVHDSGVMSYAQSFPVEDATATYRRLPPELLAHWLNLVQHLPLDVDAPGPDDEYIDPVFVSIETPDDTFGVPKVDAARPPEPYRELLSLVREWITALRTDRAAMPPGLLPYP
jgi:hypothetical protein